METEHGLQMNAQNPQSPCAKTPTRKRARLREDPFIDAMWNEAERHGHKVEPIEYLTKDRHRVCSRVLFLISGKRVHLHRLSRPQETRGNSYGKTRFEYPRVLDADFHLMAIRMKDIEPSFYIMPTATILEDLFENDRTERSIAVYFPVTISKHWRSGIGKLRPFRYFNNWKILGPNPEE